MKKTFKNLFVIAMVLSLLLGMSGLVYAIPTENLTSKSIAENYRGIPRVGVTVDRSTTSVSIKASGPVTSMADSITTIATLYEYKNGSLASTGESSTKTSYKCTSYSFKTSFPIKEGKSYKVKLEIKDSTNGKTNTMITYSSAF